MLDLACLQSPSCWTYNWLSCLLVPRTNQVVAAFGSARSRISASLQLQLLGRGFKPHNPCSHPVPWITPGHQKICTSPCSHQIAMQDSRLPYSDQNRPSNPHLPTIGIPQSCLSTNSLNTVNELSSVCKIPKYMLGPPKLTLIRSSDHRLLYPSSRGSSPPALRRHQTNGSVTSLTLPSQSHFTTSYTATPLQNGEAYHRLARRPS